MSCSFCHLAGHKVTTCQSPVLLQTVERFNNMNQCLKSKPIINSNSNVMVLHRKVGELDDNQTKGLAAKLGIKITGKSRSILNASIVRVLWFSETRYEDMCMSELHYFSHLNRIISGIDSLQSWSEYIRVTVLRENETIIMREIREMNIRRMASLAQYYEDIMINDAHQFMIIVDSLRTRHGLLQEFGGLIDIDDICQYIPVMRIFFQRDATDDMVDLLIRDISNDYEEAEEVEDVIMTQNLDLTCEYAEKIETTSEEDCSICFEDCNTRLNCGHMFCIDCVVKTVKIAMDDHRKKLTCALCRTETNYIISSDEVQIVNLAHLIG
jgi:hypothetical protein